MQSKRVRTVICAVLAAGVSATLVAVGCGDTSSDPIPGPFLPDGGLGSGNGGLFDGRYDDGGTYQDAITQPTSDGYVPTYDAGSF